MKGINIWNCILKIRQNAGWRDFHWEMDEWERLFTELWIMRCYS